MNECKLNPPGNSQKNKNNSQKKNEMGYFYSHGNLLGHMNFDFPSRNLRLPTYPIRVTLTKLDKNMRAIHAPKAAVSVVTFVFAPAIQINFENQTPQL